MIVAVVVAAGWACTVAVLVRQIARMEREHNRRVDLLINQLLHAAGKPWQPAPAVNDPEPEWEPPALIDPAQLLEV